MLTAILIIAVMVCAFGWLNRWVTTAAMTMYFLSKGCPEPTKEELSACLREVWTRVLKLDL